jgi:HlyD family secretion protein
VKKYRLWILTLAVIAIVVAYLLLGGMGKAEKTGYQFATLTRGNLESTISATGTMSPVTVVEVGTQVSGTIDTVMVDFNDLVRRGEILAVLDTSLLTSSVLDAEAGVERAEAQLDQATSDYDRNKSLFDRKMISEADLLPFSIAVKTQNASLKSAKAALQRALKNLEYAVIRSPISGIVIARNIEEGQTVAASLSTPTLFQIAEDLSHMEIIAEVDETDVGQIQDGQQVRFEVQTYSNKVFTGVVKQLRLDPSTVNNVVTYNVVIEAANDDGQLLPGMTATIDFVIEKKDSVLLVTNKALRFQPSEEQIAAFRERREKALELQPDSARTGRGFGGGHGPGRTGERPKDFGTLWYLDDTGQLAMAPVRIGMSDGINTEIVMSRVLGEGREVIVGEDSGDATAATPRATNSRQPGFGPPRGF